MSSDARVVDSMLPSLQALVVQPGNARLCGSIPTKLQNKTAVAWAGGLNITTLEPCMPHCSRGISVSLLTLRPPPPLVHELCLPLCT